MGHPNDRNIGTKGKCGVSCSFMPGFLVLMFISTWFTFMAAMPGTVATLRAVEPMHKSLALGIESIILRLENEKLREIKEYDFYRQFAINFKPIFFFVC